MVDTIEKRDVVLRKLKRNDQEHPEWKYRWRGERWHRVVNERLRATLGEDEVVPIFSAFSAIVRRAVLLHTTARSS